MLDSLFQATSPLQWLLKKMKGRSSMIYIIVFRFIVWTYHPPLYRTSSWSHRLHPLSSTSHLQLCRTCWRVRLVVLDQYRPLCSSDSWRGRSLRPRKCLWNPVELPWSWQFVPKYPNYSILSLDGIEDLRLFPLLLRDPIIVAFQVPCLANLNIFKSLTVI